MNRLLSWAGVALAASGLLHPERTALALAGAVLALVPAVRRQARVVPAALAAAYALAALAAPEFRADSGSYFAHLRSAAFDRDLDFKNEWEHWGHAPPPVTATGRRQNVQSVGPAVLWAPFYAVAHVYVATGLAAPYPADGYSAPYRRAAAWGTVTAVVLAALALGRWLERRHGRAISILSMAGVFGATSLAYYTFVVPTMAHGPAFAAMVLYVLAWHNARERTDTAAWAALGAGLGLVTLVRWQGLVAVLLAVPLVLGHLRARRLAPASLGAALAAGLAVFAPQLLVWKRLYGSWITLPQGRGFVDWSSPHLVDSLLSADRGLLTWTPAAALGLIGLGLRAREDRLFSAGALGTVLATAWVNGGVRDWAASDAFGGRRYDITLPLLAVGLAALLTWLVPRLVRHPLAVPAAAVAALVAWNLGFIAIFRTGIYREAAPLERVAGDQARLLRRITENAFGAVGGARGRALAYKVLRAEYLYTAYNPGGTVGPASDDAAERYLLRGWASRGRRADGPEFRWATAPEACVRVPLDAAFDMDVVVTAFAPGGATPQTMTLAVNGTTLGAEPLSTEWSDVSFQVPSARLVPGENELCLRFGRAMPERDGLRIAAGVARFQLP